MLAKEELLDLLSTTVTVRLGKTVSTDDRDKFCAAICAFANDMPGEGRNGYLKVFGCIPAAFQPNIGTFKVIVPSAFHGAESILTAGQSIPFATESRPLAGESIPLAAEVIPFRPESILTDSRYATRISMVESWANANLSSKIRVDARKNMVDILCVIGINGSWTQEIIGTACGLSLASVKKVMGSLQDMGLVRRSGNNRDGDWELVGFE